MQSFLFVCYAFSQGSLCLQVLSVNRLKYFLSCSEWLRFFTCYTTTLIMICKSMCMFLRLMKEFSAVQIDSSLSTRIVIGSVLFSVYISDNTWQACCFFCCKALWNTLRITVRRLNTHLLLRYLRYSSPTTVKTFLLEVVCVTTQRAEEAFAYTAFPPGWDHSYAVPYSWVPLMHLRRWWTSSHYNFAGFPLNWDSFPTANPLSGLVQITGEWDIQWFIFVANYLQFQIQ